MTRPSRTSKPERGSLPPVPRARLSSRVVGVTMVLPLVAMTGLGLGLTSIASAASVNRVVNPDFELGTAGWKSISPGSIGTSTGRTGNAAKLTNSGSTAKTVALNDTVNTVSSTVQGQSYVAGAWIRSTVPSRSVAVRMMEYAGSTYKGQAIGTTTLSDTAWHYVSVTYKAAAGASTLDLNVLGSQLPGGSSILVDDVSLVDQVSTTTADTAAPTAPPALTAGSATSSSVALSWTAASDNVGVTGYRVVRNGTVLAGTLTGLSYTDTALAPSATYRYTVRAVDAAGNTSTDSPPATITTIDTVAPTAPPALSAGSATSSSVALSWTAASDNVAVTGYRVVRNGTVLAAPLTGLSYTDTALTPSTSYQYTVRAVDAAGNTSTNSPSATIATTTPPLTDSTYVTGWGSPTWSDEFNGSSVDTTKWRVRNGDYLSYDLACVNSANVTQGGGYLTIASRREAGCQSRAYTTGYLDTIGLKSWTKGRFEMRAQLPMAKNASKGVWPAFWLRPNDGGAGEIDAMEAYGTGADGSGGDGHEYGETHATIWNTYSPSTHEGNSYQTGTNISAGFHVWTAEWEAGVIRFYFDGVLNYTRSTSTTSWFGGVYDQNRPFNIRLNQQVGGSWTGSPDSATAFPANYLVDYIRVYQR